MIKFLAALGLILLSTSIAKADTYDHLIRCTTEADCIADPVVGKFYTPGENGSPGNWRQDITIPNVRVWVVTGTQTITDPITGQDQIQEVRSYFPGFYILIAETFEDHALEGLANNACRVVANRDAASRGEQAFLYMLAADIDPNTVSFIHMEPTFAIGPSDHPYPFGSVIQQP